MSEGQTRKEGRMTLKEKVEAVLAVIGPDHGNLTLHVSQADIDGWEGSKHLTWGSGGCWDTIHVNFGQAFYVTLMGPTRRPTEADYASNGAPNAV